MISEDNKRKIFLGENVQDEDFYLKIKVASIAYCYCLDLLGIVNGSLFDCAKHINNQCEFNLQFIFSKSGSHLTIRITNEQLSYAFTNSLSRKDFMNLSDLHKDKLEEYTFWVLSPEALEELMELQQLSSFYD